MTRWNATLTLVLLICGSAFARPAIVFEQNRGQSANEVQFLARAADSVVFLTRSAAVLKLSGRDVITLKLLGAEMTQPRGERPSTAAISYFTGRDPQQWRTNVSAYEAVRYAGVYRGIDLIYHATGGAIEYDFDVRPAADPHAIRLRFEGARGLSISSEGELLLQTATGVIRQPRPLAYQIHGVSRNRVAAEYVLTNGGTEIGFRLGPYDRRKRLLIDPVLRYSTYLGGSDWEIAYSIAADSAGNAYVTGYTESVDFPGGPAPRERDVFVTKLDPAGALVYTAILGGASFDQGGAIAVGPDGSVHVTGDTSSVDFPVRNAVQPLLRGSADAFLARLDPSGTNLVYSTYLGGSDIENYWGASRKGGIVIDAEGTTYVTGNTYSSDFPATAGAAQETFGGQIDAFVASIRTDREGPDSLVYATYLGGSGQDWGWSIAVDGAGNAYVSGRTESADFPVTAGAFQRQFRFVDGFAAKLQPSRGALAYATYLGGSSLDEAVAVAVDGAGNAYVVSSTMSIDYPTVRPIQTEGGGLFHSTNGGQRWIKNNDGLRSSGLLGIGILALDPSRPERIYATSSHGVFRSDDGGVTWSETGTGLPLDEYGLAVRDISIDPSGREVFVATDMGLYRSLDGGPWTARDEGFPLQGWRGRKSVLFVTIDPHDPGVVYASADYPDYPFFKSADSGQTWVRIDGTLPPNTNKIFVAVDPHRPATAYLGTSRGIYRSDDGGQSWERLNLGVTGGPVHAITFHPQDRNTIYVGTRNHVVKSTDGGETWNYTSSGIGEGKITALVIDPDQPSTLYVSKAAFYGLDDIWLTTDSADESAGKAVKGGIFKSVDGGEHWVAINEGLESNLAVTILVPPGGNGRVLAFASPQGDVAITKLDASGSQALFSTYLSGRDTDVARAAVLACGNRLVVAGTTMSEDFPLRHPIQTEHQADYLENSFVTALSLTGSEILFSTYFGAPSSVIVRAVAADCQGNLYLAGSTNRDLPLKNALQPQFGGMYDAFVAKIDGSVRRRGVRH